MVKGLECMAEGDLEGAGQAFQRSIDMSETPGMLYARSDVLSNYLQLTPNFNYIAALYNLALV